MTPGNKVLIILVWLLVPIAASLFMRNSYAAYVNSCQVQRQNCELRAWHIDQYSRELKRFTPAVDGITSPQLYKRWQQDFQRIRTRQESAASKLDLGQPEYYVATDSELVRLEVKLADMFRQIDQAGLTRLDYVRSAERLDNLLVIQRDLEGSAYYYKRMGMEGIYMQFQEELAKVEDEIRTRRRMRADYFTDVSELLQAASDGYDDIQRSLDHIGEKLDEDESTTYRSELRNRIVEFNLGEELSALLGDSHTRPAGSLKQP